VIVWRVRGKIIRYVLCITVCNSFAQCSVHMNRPKSCLLVRFSFFVVILHVTVCWICSFLGLFCVIVYLCMCAFVVLDLVSSVLCHQIS